jgi:Icc-related predicted phosphoesterase
LKKIEKNYKKLIDLKKKSYDYFLIKGDLTHGSIVKSLLAAMLRCGNISVQVGLGQRKFANGQTDKPEN